ncbi:hypothetical protein HOP52_00445 [Halomonas campisalis]|uniref:Flagellar hook-length control protein-like C-terminal domain-containing protein n=1 Tax=Billgrantia campisalis TaxID=74661 RepID=A0ABS9P4C3_9GAMM|nr:flagellar hook-length control protein FliK [Halomonas campisalis]MCG6656249.1 hypothetical protein [Halomonas campisalis]MDR5861436.1 flagellar hook-length control protein FliK [Halomonas campisalis]
MRWRPGDCFVSVPTRAVREPNREIVMDVKMMLASLAGQPTTSQSTPGGRATASQFSLSLASAAGQPATPKGSSATSNPNAASPRPGGQAIQDALLQRLAWHASQQDLAELELPDGLQNDTGAAALEAVPLEALLERVDWHDALDGLAELELPDDLDTARVDPHLLEAIVERMAEQGSPQAMAQTDLNLPDDRNTVAFEAIPLDAILERMARQDSPEAVTQTDLPDDRITAAVEALPLEAILERIAQQGSPEAAAKPEELDAAWGDPHLLEAMVERMAQQGSPEAAAQTDLPDDRNTVATEALTLDAILERMALIQGLQESPRPLSLDEKLALSGLPADQRVTTEPSDSTDSRADDNAWQDMPEAQALMTAPGSPATLEGARETTSPSLQESTRPAPPSTQWENPRSEAMRHQGQGASSSVANADTATRQGFMSQLDARGDNPIRSLEASAAATAQVAASTPANPSAEASRSAAGTPESVPLAALSQGNSGTTAATAPQPGPAQATLSPPLQSQAWPSQLGQQLVQFARLGGEQRIEMQLHPAELGPLSVTLKMTEQGAQAQFLSAHAQVRQAIEQAIPQLREALAEQGIELSDTSVGEQRQQDTQAFADTNGQGGQPRGSGGDSDDALADTDGLDPQAVETGISLDGRVNLYA